jgi:hypothetical protein
MGRSCTETRLKKHLIVVAEKVNKLIFCIMATEVNDKASLHPSDGSPGHSFFKVIFHPSVVVFRSDFSQRLCSSNFLFIPYILLSPTWLFTPPLPVTLNQPVNNSH